MSFDPAQIADLRAIAPRLPRGMVAEKQGWDEFAAAPKRAIITFAHVLSARPQFIAYAVRDLPALLPAVARSIFRLPLLTWTVRSADDRRKAARYADQMIFEGFRP
jgi:glycerophosphoryl diester phosphodiesterase